jgi:hypothetical protein
MEVEDGKDKGGENKREASRQRVRRCRSIYLSAGRRSGHGITVFIISMRRARLIHLLALAGACSWR